MLSWDLFGYQVNLTQTDRKNHIGIPTAFLLELKVVTLSFSSGSADTGIFNKMQNDNEREYKLMKFNREKTDLFKYISRTHDQEAAHVWKRLFILKLIPGICSLQKALYSFMSKECHKGLIQSWCSASPETSQTQEGFISHEAKICFGKVSFYFLKILLYKHPLHLYSFTPPVT